MTLILTLIYDQSSLFMGSVSLSYSFLCNCLSINEMKLVDQPGWLNWLKVMGRMYPQICTSRLDCQILCQLSHSVVIST